MPTTLEEQPHLRIEDTDERGPDLPFVSDMRSWLNAIRLDFLRQSLPVQLVLILIVLQSLITFSAESTRWTLAHFHNDLEGYLLGAYVLRTGGNPYDNAQIHHAAIALGSASCLDVPPAGAHHYISPISLAFFLRPLTLLSLDMSGHIWDVLMVAAYSSGVLLLLSTFLRSSAALFCVGLFLAANSEPYTLGLGLGQISPFIFFLDALAVWFAHKRRFNMAAISIGVGAGLKVYPAVLLIVFLVRRHYKAFLLGATLTVAGLILPALLVPKAVALSFLQTVCGISGITYDWAQNQSFTGLFYRLFVVGDYYRGIVNCPLLAKFASLGTTLLGVAVFLAVMIRNGRNLSYSFLLSFAILTTDLFASLTWDHYLVNTLIATMFLVSCLSNDRNNSGMPFELLITALAALIIVMPVDYLRVPFSKGILILFTSIKMYGVLGLWLILARLGLKRQSLTLCND
jgi:hypothetical protein